MKFVHPRLWIYRVSKHLHALADKIYYRIAGRENRPVFFDIDETKPELRRLDAAVTEIRAELDEVLADKERIPRYHDLDARQTEIASVGDAAWRTFFVQLQWAGDRLPNRKLCPKTAALLDGIPGVMSGMFSILEPGKTVAPHNGPAFWYLRYQLALRVPREKPPTLRVKDQYHTWQEGVSMLFDDSWEHEVFNESDDYRVVLIVDIQRPVPWPISVFGRVLQWMRIPPRSTWDEILTTLSPSDSYIVEPPSG